MQYDRSFAAPPLGAQNVAEPRSDLSYALETPARVYSPAPASRSEAPVRSQANSQIADARPPTHRASTSARSAPDDDSPLPVGTEFLDDLYIPEPLRYDLDFLRYPRHVQRAILKAIADGKLEPRMQNVVDRTERRTVRLRLGQKDALEKIISHASPYEADRRRSLSYNSLLRELIDLFVMYIAPHLDLAGVSTEAGLRQALVSAFRRAAQKGAADILG